MPEATVSALGSQFEHARDQTRLGAIQKIEIKTLSDSKKLYQKHTTRNA